MQKLSVRRIRTGIVFTLVGTVVFGTTLALGHWLYSLFRPITLELEYEPSTD